MINNKNILITTAFCILTSTNFAQAEALKSGAYIGVDAIRSYVKHQYLAEDTPDELAEINGARSSAKSNGFGANLGYRFASNKFFIAPEIFFNYLKNSAKDFDYANDPAVVNNRLEITHSYGAKVNFGANLFSKLNAFVNIGTSNVDFVFTGYDQNTVRNSMAQFVMVYGGGLSFDISDHLTLKASYDWSQFSTRYDFNVEKNRILLQTIKMGIAYNF